ncbi:MAG: DUF6266 family protein [Candidatus Pedobacter colombiensis]|uniref:DUF6266 family protein n=1 Tax=Candidatus Pedobacter colombiensis TaxID=3121371 RepID=A0AAJ6B8N1_9SPHI|nr:DUF6266 family protein [Pedobacter sp.]WEK21064.1 MAG: DUF6266 family protein [Pedobacter sp.]
MAISKNGPLGLYSGKLGPLYGYILNGKQVLRAARHKSNIPRSSKQLAYQEKMTVLTSFFRTITPYIRIGFALSAKKRLINSNNAAKSYNLIHGITGEYPGQTVNYPMIRLTEGGLSVAKNALVENNADGFKFSWAYDPLDQEGNRNDKTMLMAHFTEKEESHYLISGAERDKLEEVLHIPHELKGHEAETYISFVTDDRKAISNSVYIGKFMF